MSTAFKGSTVFTIAHRINTIIKSDMILVLPANSKKPESGAPASVDKKLEYDTPAKLQANPNSEFMQLIKEIEEKKKEEEEANAK